VRLSDAMRRGALCHDTTTGTDSIDFLRLDWFTLAPSPLEQIREQFRVTPKSPEAVAAGSVGPRDPGGISSFQLQAGRELAARHDRPYERYDAPRG
jgi:hypothetical protein